MRYYEDRTETETARIVGCAVGPPGNGHRRRGVVVIGLPRGGWPVPLYDIDQRWNLVTLVAKTTRIDRQVRLPDRQGFGDATFWPSWLTKAAA